MPLVPPSLASKRHDAEGFEEGIRRSLYAERHGFPNLHYGNPLRQPAAGGDGENRGSHGGYSGSIAARTRGSQDTAPHPRRIVANSSNPLSLNLAGLPHPPPLKVPHPPRKSSGGEGKGGHTTRGSPATNIIPDRNKAEPAYPLSARATNLRLGDASKLKSWASEALNAPAQPLTARAPPRSIAALNQEEAGSQVKYQPPPSA